MRHVVFTKILVLCGLLSFVGPVPAENAADFSVDILAEEHVYDFIPPDNGSGPLWSFGCSPIARVGGEVIISQMDTGVDVPKLSNTRWRLLRRTQNGWECIAEAEAYLQREPTVLATLPGGRFYLNTNDLIDPPGTRYGRTAPKLLAFTLAAETEPPKTIVPEWNRAAYFTDHSYRGFGADRAQELLLMLNIDAKTSVQHWALLNNEGSTLRNGEVEFPIRANYPQLALTGGTAHMLAMGNIVEPVQVWRDYKFEQTGREWDYVRRILYYTTAPDIFDGPFSAPIEVANVDATGGDVRNHDLWIAPNGDAYALYSECEVASELLRDQFFPEKSLIPSLHLAIIKNNRVVERHVLVEGSEEAAPGMARFHSTPSGNVYALIYIHGPQPANLLMRVYPHAGDAPPIPVPFQHPFTGFLLANVRAGNAPSHIMDIVGHQDSIAGIRYGQVVIKETHVREVL